MFIGGPVSFCTYLILLFVLTPAAAHAPSSADFAGLIDIGAGRKMYLECRGTGSPTVVLVAGLKASAEDWSIAGKSAPAVFPEVAKFTRVCAYDRPGTPVGEKPSRSDPVEHHTVVWSSGFMRAPTPKAYPVLSSSTLSPKGFAMQRRLSSGRYNES